MSACVRLALCLALLMAACGPESTLPGAPSPDPASPPAQDQWTGPIPSVAGTWSGRSRGIRCASQCCAQACTRSFFWAPPEWDFTLTLSQEGGEVSGTFEKPPLPSVSGLGGHVWGRLRPSDRVELSGFLRILGVPNVDGWAGLQDFNTIIDPSRQGMKGRFVMVGYRSSGEEWVRTEYEILKLERLER